MASGVRDTKNELCELTDSLVNLPNNNPPSLYLDLDDAARYQYNID